MFEPQCSQTWTRCLKHLIVHFISLSRTYCNPKWSDCMSMPRPALEFLTCRSVLCWFSAVNRDTNLKDTALAPYIPFQACHIDSWFAYSWLWGLLTCTFTTMYLLLFCIFHQILWNNSNPYIRGIVLNKSLQVNITTLILISNCLTIRTYRDIHVHLPTLSCIYACRLYTKHKETQCSRVMQTLKSLGLITFDPFYFFL